MGDFARLHEVHVVPTEPVLDRDEQFVEVIIKNPNIGTCTYCVFTRPDALTLVPNSTFEGNDKIWKLKLS